MGDSDEEYQRRRREKFRRERNDYTERRDDRRGGRGGEQWEERGNRDGGWSGGRNRERNREPYRESYDRGNRHDRYSPQRGHDMSPPQTKRMRRDWDDNGGGGGNYGGDSYGGRGGGGWHGHDNHQNQGHYRGGGMTSAHNRGESEYPTQPQMMPFKMFLAQQDDNITDEESIKKFNDYKLEFKRTQINEFFLAHKDEEWFRARYHPEECVKRKDDARRALKKRADIFSKLLNMGRIGQLSVDLERSADIVKLLDAAVIFMEGGSDFDLKALEIPDPPPDDGRRNRQMSESQRSRDAERRDSERSNTERQRRPERRGTEEESMQEGGERKNKKRRREDENGQEGTDAAKPPKPSAGKEGSTEVVAGGGGAGGKAKPGGGGGAKAGPPPHKAGKDGRAEEEGSESSGSSGDEGSASESDEPERGKRGGRDYNDESGSDSESGSSSGSESDGGEGTPPGKGEEKGKAVSLEPSQQVDGTADDDEEGGVENDGEEPEKDLEEGEAPAQEEPLPADKPESKPEADKDQKAEGEKEEGEEGEEGEEEKEVDTAATAEPEEGEEEPQPRALHKTCSIFLRNLFPTITKLEIEAMCKRYPGFLRVALQDPQPERRFYRRGWVTFDRTVNIVDVCWNLNNIRLRDCEMGAIVNRDLKQRVRPVNGISAHKQVVKADIKHAALITQALDNKWKIWADEDDEKKDKGKDEMSFGFVSKNPVLKNITDYLVEEGNFEEEELLGLTVGEKAQGPHDEVNIERDPELCKVLDRMILYLRIVHSFDFYSAVEYPNEDEMPHRCGIMHARGPPPLNRFTNNDVNDWLSQFENKIRPFTKADTELNEAEAKKMGRKDIDEELEKFVQANTQELAKDKWLCPLSGKKFKGPEFVRKHIFNKHAEKVDEVKKEVLYFNHYLVDPQRPQLPEHPGNRQSSVGHSRRDDSSHNNAPSGGAASYTAPQQASGGNYGGGGGNYGGGGGGGYQGGGGGGYQAKRGGGGSGYRGGYHNRNDNYNNRNNDRPQQRDRAPPRRGDRRSDPRSIIQYTDLDAPEDMDIF